MYQQPAACRSAQFRAAFPARLPPEALATAEWDTEACAAGAAAAAAAGPSNATTSAATAANLCLRMAETAILNMSVFLLRVLVRHKGPGRVLRTPAGTALASG